MIDAKSAKVVATIALGGSPEFGVADSEAGRVYCNLEDKNEVVAIDTTKHEVVSALAACAGRRTDRHRAGRGASSVVRSVQ